MQKPSDRMVVTVWDTVENSPGYAALIDLLARLFGESVADWLRAPYALGDLKALQQLLTAAGFSEIEATTPKGTARFPSLESWMSTEIKGWVLADVLDQAQFDLLVQEANKSLAPFVDANGSVAFDAPAHISRVVKL